MFPPNPASNGINAAITGSAENVLSYLFVIDTAMNSPIRVINSQGIRALIECDKLPVKISSSSHKSVTIPDDV